MSICANICGHDKLDMFFKKGICALGFIGHFYFTLFHCSSGCEKYEFRGENMETVIHNGGCHCRRVRWQAEAPSSVTAVTCNCSNCAMRGSTAFVVPKAKFKLLGESEQHLNTYTFGTHTAKHLFCNVCGITSFYIQREHPENPDCVAIVVSCVDSGTLKHVQIRHFDGKSWE
ncbi:centromere protein V-like isoform X2 [Dioscorea cayenensis subsp. rotundata]|uniref:Centromere protein V-like isoform X2 n=1 Tax=Dioscorea cayennensis subsp. rotundata TaxID=55577 RepID=A0AB40B8T3_DIOCR|nr:centromere protein V-like isoform X2 [Dioscorea cayenensis subsp. rotundata]